MRRDTFYSCTARPVLRIVVCAVALMGVACGGDVNINPTPLPPFVFEPVGSMRTLEILGSLTVEQGLVSEATVLYDGEELAGARAVCPEAGGCTELELKAEARSVNGQHTISYRVLRQSSDAVGYMADGTILVSRDGLGMVATLVLTPTRATLRTGDSVTFEITFID